MKTICLIVLSLFLANCTERPKAEIINKPPPKPVEKTTDDFILEASAESFFAASLARYTMRVNPFENKCGKKSTLPENSCIRERKGTAENIKILNYDHCKEISGTQTFTLSKDKESDTETLVVKGLLQFTVGKKKISRTQTYTATIKKEGCVWRQLVDRDGKDYFLQDATYDIEKDEMEIGLIEVEMGPKDAGSKESKDGEKFAKTFELSEVTLQWKKACQHPPVGLASFEYFDSTLPTPTIKGKIESVADNVVLPQGNGGVKKLNWESKCLSGTSTGEAPIGALMSLEN